MSASVEKFRSDSLWMVLLGVAAGAATAVFFSLLNIRGEITGVVASGVALLPPAIANEAQERRVRRKGGSTSKTDPTKKPRILVIALSVGTLTLVWQSLGVIYMLLIGLPLWTFVDGAPASSPLSDLGDGEENELLLSMVYTVLYVTFLPLLYLTVRRTAHYLERHAYALTFVILLLSELISYFLAIITGQFLTDPLLIVLLVLYIGVEYGVAVLACFHARRSQAQFVVARSFRKLPPADRIALLQLVNEALDSLPAADARASDVR